jgi:hypothetical protein
MVVAAVAAAAVLLCPLIVPAVVAGVEAEAAEQAEDLPARAVAVQQHQLQHQHQQRRLLSVLVLWRVLRSRCAGCSLTVLRQSKGRPGDYLLVLLLLHSVVMMMQQQRKQKPSTLTLSRLLGWHSQQQLIQGHAGLSRHLDSGTHVFMSLVDV